MPDYQQHIQQRLDFAMQLIRLGKPDKAVAVCEQLMSPASIFTYGKSIFEVMSEAMNATGDKQRAELFLQKSIEYFPQETQSAITGEIVNSQSSSKNSRAISALLPNLEFAADSPITASQSVDIFIEYSPFPTIKKAHLAPTAIAKNNDQSKSISALEDLAKKLESAKIPVITEDRTFDSPAYKPSIVTDTMAQIYVSQGAYAQAIKAYQILARNNPDKLDYYEAIIADLRTRH